MINLKLSWSRDEDGVVTIYGTDPKTGRVAEVADFWRRPLRERLALSILDANALQDALAEALIAGWEARQEGKK